MSGGFLIEPLGAHDRSGFSCGAKPLDRYLREQQMDARPLFSKTL